VAWQLGLNLVFSEAETLFEIHWGLGIRTGVGVSVSKLVRIKFVQIVKIAKGGLVI
jgi:hypothetical protein